MRGQVDRQRAQALSAPVAALKVAQGQPWMAAQAERASSEPSGDLRKLRLLPDNSRLALQPPLVADRARSLRQALRGCRAASLPEVDRVARRWFDNNIPVNEIAARFQAQASGHWPMHKGRIRAAFMDAIDHGRLLPPPSPALQYPEERLHNVAMGFADFALARPALDAGKAMLAYLCEIHAAMLEENARPARVVERLAATHKGGTFDARELGPIGAACLLPLLRDDKGCDCLLDYLEALGGRTVVELCVDEKDKRQFENLERRIRRRAVRGVPRDAAVALAAGPRLPASVSRGDIAGARQPPGTARRPAPRGFGNPKVFRFDAIAEAASRADVLASTWGKGQRRGVRTLEPQVDRLPEELGPRALLLAAVLSERARDALVEVQRHVADPWYTQQVDIQHIARRLKSILQDARGRCNPADAFIRAVDGGRLLRLTGSSEADRQRSLDKLASRFAEFVALHRTRSPVELIAAFLDDAHASDFESGVRPSRILAALRSTHRGGTFEPMKLRPNECAGLLPLIRDDKGCDCLLDFLEEAGGRPVLAVTLADGDVPVFRSLTERSVYARLEERILVRGGMRKPRRGP